uniref:Uncharacterized protein n=1 Tax=Anopheles christyi TaxID=43041 RepID=A0A182KIQ1_9DIPT
MTFFSGTMLRYKWKNAEPPRRGHYRTTPVRYFLRHLWRILSRARSADGHSNLRREFRTHGRCTSSARRTVRDRPAIRWRHRFGTI